MVHSFIQAACPCKLGCKQVEHTFHRVGVASTHTGLFLSACSRFNLRRLASPISDEHRCGLAHFCWRAPAQQPQVSGIMCVCEGQGVCVCVVRECKQQSNLKRFECLSAALLSLEGCSPPPAPLHMHAHWPHTGCDCLGRGQAVSGLHVLALRACIRSLPSSHTHSANHPSQTHTHPHWQCKHCVGMHAGCLAHTLTCLHSMHSLLHSTACSFKHMHRLGSSKSSAQLVL